MIEIKESTYDDIKNIQGLWADADVMKYIWPGGLQPKRYRMPWKKLLKMALKRFGWIPILQTAKR